MQDIYIDNVKIKNVANYTGEMDFDFPPGFTLIVGKNGSGKSTIFKSIALALYGDSGGTDKLPISDFVNRKSKKDLEIIVNFRIVENDVSDVYTVRLYQDHKQFKNKMFLIKNGIDISGKSKTETYEMIERILLPRSIFHNTVYFSQQVKDFFTSLTNTEQKQIFDSILSTGDYKAFYNNSDSTLKILLSHTSGLSNTISNIQTTIDAKKSAKIQFLDTKDKALKENETMIAVLTQKRTQKENEIQVLQSKNQDRSFDQSELDRLNFEYMTVQRQIEHHQSLLNDGLEIIQKEMNEAIAKSSMLLSNEKTQKISKITEDASKKLEEVNLQIRSLSDSLLEAERKYDTTALLKDHNAFRNEKQKEITTVNQEISLLDVEFSTSKLESESKDRSRIIEKNIQDLKDKATKIKDSATAIKSAISEREAVIRDDEDKLNQEVPVCSKCFRPFSSASDSDIIKNSIEKHRKEIAELTSKINEYKSQIEVLKEQYESATEIKNKSESDYQDKIKEKLAKKKERTEFLIRKRDLIQDEISDHKSKVDAETKNILAMKETKTSDLKEKKSLHESSAGSIRTSKDLEITQIEHNYLKELNSCKIEHIKKYGITQDEIRKKFDLQKSEFILVEQRTALEIKRVEAIKKEVDTTTESIQSLSAELKSINQRLTECKLFTFDDVQIIKLENEIDSLEKKMLKLNGEIIECQRHKVILEFWKEAFSDTGIKSMLIDMAIPHMNESVSKALDVVAPGVFTVSFDTLKITKSGDVRDKFNVNVLHNIKGTDSHKMLSGGEKRLVDLCCMEAIRSLSEKLYGKRIHNIFYDEVLDSLDDDSCQIFGQASKALAVGKNITLIAHRATENIEPDRIFNF